MRRWLEKRERSYVLAVTSSKSVYYEGTQRRVGKVARSLPEETWMRASVGKGTKGERLYEWACVALPESGMYREEVRAGRWLLMRRSIAGGEPEEEEEEKKEKKKKKIAYYLCYGPAQTTVDELIRIAGRRWTIEEIASRRRRERSASTSTR